MTAIKPVNRSYIMGINKKDYNNDNAKPNNRLFNNESVYVQKKELLEHLKNILTPCN